MTILMGGIGSSVGGIVIEEFVQPTDGQTVFCQNPAGCTARWNMFRVGTCNDCPQWFTPVQEPQRTWHFRWRLSGCIQDQGVPINTWTEFTAVNYSWQETCFNPDIDNCTGTIDVSYDGGTTVHGTFTFGCFCDASP